MDRRNFFLGLLASTTGALVSKPKVEEIKIPTETKAWEIVASGHMIVDERYQDGQKKFSLR